MAYRGTHADINALMLFPWPDGARINISGGQLGTQTGLTWRQYLAAIGEYWEATYRYPRFDMHIDPRRMTVNEVSYWGQIFGLATRAMIERGYLRLDGSLNPPMPFVPPPSEYRETSTSPNPIHHEGDAGAGVPGVDPSTVIPPGGPT